jgi:putative ATPase
MREFGYGKDYNYAHNYEGNFVNQDYLPQEIDFKKFFEPGANSREDEIRRFLKNRWGEKYGY